MDGGRARIIPAFAQAIDRLHAEGRYRVFIDILRNKGMFPMRAASPVITDPKPITVWCSNDYLAMGHIKVIAAMEEALHDVGAGSGGTRNIGGNTHYHIDRRRTGRPARQGSRHCSPAAMSPTRRRWRRSPRSCPAA
jgi:hypothetical protein